MIDRSKYLDVFIEEARENLQIVNNVLLELEENGYKDESINEVFRIAHTIKGYCRCDRNRPYTRIDACDGGPFRSASHSQDCP